MGDFSMSDNMFLIENGVLKGFNSIVSKDEKNKINAYILKKKKKKQRSKIN